MTTKEEFKKLFPYNGIIIEDNGQKYSLDDIWSYFQSKQQREDYEFTRKEIIEWLHEQNWKCEKLEKLLIQPKK